MDSSSACGRLRIWEVDCVLLDTVLTLSFDVGELFNLCRSAGHPVEAKKKPTYTAIVPFVHRQCHADSALARLVERHLDLMHEAERAKLDELGLKRYGAGILGQDPCELPSLAATIWVVLTADHPLGKKLRAHLRRTLTLTGARLLGENIRGF